MPGITNAIPRAPQGLTVRTSPDAVLTKIFWSIAKANLQKRFTGFSANIALSVHRCRFVSTVACLAISAGERQFMEGVLNYFYLKND
jgi:hypothetical protein